MKTLMILAATAMLAGCGGLSQKQWRAMDDMLYKAQTADCATVQMYIGIARTEVQKKLK